MLYRLNLIALHLPPLRERAADIPLIAQHFLSALAKVYRRTQLSLHLEAQRWLQPQPWPGNVRQLRHTLERALLVSKHDTLHVADFTTALAMDAPPEREAVSVDGLPPIGAMTLEQIEEAMIRKALAHHDGNMSRVAEALGLSRAALYRRFEKYGIEA